eukprot:5907392-Lingulodinium_polyedra.AAC.1
MLHEFWQAGKGPNKLPTAVERQPHTLRASIQLGMSSRCEATRCVWSFVRILSAPCRQAVQ